MKEGREMKFSRYRIEEVEATERGEEPAHSVREDKQQEKRKRRKTSDWSLREA